MYGVLRFSWKVLVAYIVLINDIIFLSILWLLLLWSFLDLSIEDHLLHLSPFNKSGDMGQLFIRPIEWHMIYLSCSMRTDYALLQHQKTNSTTRWHTLTWKFLAFRTLTSLLSPAVLNVLYKTFLMVLTYGLQANILESDMTPWKRKELLFEGESSI